MKSLLMTLALLGALGSAGIDTASAGSRLSQAEADTMKALLDKMHGQRTMTGQYNGYRGDKPGRIQPPPGCKESVVYNARLNRYFVRWYSDTNPNC